MITFNFSPVVDGEEDYMSDVIRNRVEDLEVHSDMIDFLKKNEIQTVFHYIPLHTPRWLEEVLESFVERIDIQ